MPSLSATVKTKPWLPILLLCVFAFLFIWVGVRGVDFGTHWDEHKITDSMERALESGNSLPGWYNYPSMTYNLAYAALARRVLTYSRDNPPMSLRGLQEWWNGMRPVLLDRVQTSEFTLTVRKVFILMSALTSVWVFLLVRGLRRTWWEATLAGILLLASWEYGYHSRWIAPDLLLVHFSTAWFAFLALGAQKQPNRGWLVAAVIAASLACASKYPGGFFLVPVLVVAWIRTQGNFWTRLSFVTLLTALFAGVFYITSPGIFLELSRGMADIFSEMSHYSLGHAGHTVQSGWQHLGLILVYLLGVVFSHQPVLAILVSILMIIGGVLVWRMDNNRLVGRVMILTMLAYLVYFSTQRVMFVRNMMALVPLMAVLAALGAGYLFRKSTTTWKRVALVGMLTVLLGYNFFWQWQAANSIRSGGPEKCTAILDVLNTKSQQVYWLSPEAREILHDCGFSLPANVIGNPQAAPIWIFHSDEVSVKSISYWTANRMDYSLATIGPDEMNFNYYPNWSGRGRVVVMRQAYAQNLLPYLQGE